MAKQMATKVLARVAALANVDPALCTVESLTTREASADKLIGEGFAVAHDCMVIRLAHAATHGDYTGIAARYAAASAPLRKAIGAWLPQCSPLIVDGGKIVKSREPDAPEYSVEWARANALIAVKPAKPDADQFMLAQLRDYLKKKGNGKNVDPAAAKMADRLARLVEDAIAEGGDKRAQEAIDADGQAAEIERNRKANALTQAKADGKAADAE